MYGSMITIVMSYLIHVPLALLLAFYLNWGLSGFWWANALCMSLQGSIFLLLIWMSDWNEITKRTLERIQKEKEALKTRDQLDLLEYEKMATV